MLNRIVKNWKTTMAAIIPAIVAVGTALGTNIDPALLGSIAGGVYAILFLFMKDQPPKE